MKKVINVNVAIEIDDDLLTHLVKTSKLDACRRAAECIPELRTALGKIIEKKFFSSGTRQAVDEVFEDGFSKTNGATKE